MGEEKIIQLIHNRDPAGMEQLLLHFGPLMRYIIAPILSDPRDREECLSEAAMKAWEGVERYDPVRGSWTGWPCWPSGSTPPAKPAPPFAAPGRRISGGILRKVWNGASPAGRMDGLWGW